VKQRIAIIVSGVSIGLGLMVGAVVAYRAVAATPSLRGMTVGETTSAHNFMLVGADGEAVLLAGLRGKVVVLSFGYTFCPDVCPTTLSDLNRAVSGIGDQANQVQVIVVSVDPERDTPARTDHYVKGFNPGLVGLSGSHEQVVEAASPFGIFYQRVEVPESAAGYLVDHTSTIHIIDRNCLLRVISPCGLPVDDMIADLQALLTSQGLVQCLP
jgi:protein SCO1/2